MDFTDLFRSYLARTGLSHVEFAATMGDVAASFISQLATRRAKPPLDRLDQLARALNLAPSERPAFFEEAMLSHCPPEVAAQFRQMRAELMVHEAGMAATEARVSDLLVENGRLRRELESLKRQ